MAYAITLRLDGMASVMVEAMWRALASHELSDEASSPGYSPHLTLAVFADGVRPERLLTAAREWAAQWPAMPTTFASLGLFPGPPSTLFLAPIVTPELLQRHAALLTFLTGEPIDPHYRCGQFVPHVTLASDLADPAAAVAALNPLPLPIQAVLDRLDVVRFRPVEIMESHILRGA